MFCTLAVLQLLHLNLPPPPPGSCGSLQWVTPASDAQLLNYQVFFQSICKPFVFIAASKIYLNM